MRFLLDDGREHGAAIALNAVAVLNGSAPVELRALPVRGRRGVLHGVFADRARLRAALARLIADDDARAARGEPPHWSGLFVSLHTLAPHVIVTDELRGGAGAIAAGDVAGFNWLFVDVDRADPLRRLGNATDAERAACLDVAAAIADDFAGLGAPAGSVGVIQGANGAAVLLRLHLPAPAGKRLLDAVLRGLAERHRRAGVMLDPMPSGPTAHLRLPGTVARKHPPTLGRPWGVAWLLRVPERECIAPASVLERLASRDPSRRERRQPPPMMRRPVNEQPAEGTTLDALRHFAAQWGVRREHTSGGAAVLELERCPYQAAQGGEHRTPGKAFLSFFPSGRWEPGCHSPKCSEGLTWRWLTGAFGHPGGGR